MMLNRFLISGVFIALVSSNVVAKESQATGLLYEIKKDSVCFLAGFNHFEPTQKTKIQPRIEQAFTQSDLFVIEAYAEKSLEQKGGPVFNSSAALRDDVIIDGELQKLMKDFFRMLKPTGNWDEDSKQLKKLLPSDMYANFITTTGRALQLQKQNLGDLSPGLDTLLLQRATSTGKTVVGLEPNTLHTTIWLKQSSQVLRQSLLKESYLYAMNPKTVRTEIAIAEAIYAGNYELFEGLYTELYANYPTLKMYGPATIEQRNLVWIPAIVSVLDQKRTKPCFISVGAAHLLGDQGLLKLLMRSGATVTRLDSL
jgi:uncharacterized protein